MARVVQGLSGLILAGILVHSYLLAVMLLQFYLAGANTVGAESWEWHESWGYVLGAPILLLMVLTLIGRLGLRVIGVATLLAVLFAAQLALNRVRVDSPYLPMLNAANGLAMMGLTAAIDLSQHPDDDAQRKDAGPVPNGDHHRQRGSQVDNGASEHRPLSHQIPTFEVARETREGVPVGSQQCTAGRCDMISAPGSPPLADDLVRMVSQVRISRRHGREMKGVRIDKGVKDEPIRV